MKPTPAIVATEYVYAYSEAEALQFHREQQGSDSIEHARKIQVPGENPFEVTIIVRRIEP